MRIVRYIRSSFQKLKNDALAKLSYEAIKYLVFLLIATSGLTLAGLWVNFLTFMHFRIELNLFVVITISIVLVILTIVLVNIRFRKAYKKLLSDNHTDELTGLKNHKALNEYLTSAILTTNDKPLSLILIDVDDFKKFNTKTSHTVADIVLKKLGELLGSDKRSTDETFRYFLRGDEFIVVAKETNQHQAFQAAERKRDLIENHAFEVDDKFHNLTVSCGVTEFKEGDDYNSFTDRVSKALNLAKKEKGKNCTKSIN